MGKGKEVSCEGYEYRVQGGEMHRRPIDQEGLKPWEAAWMVMNQPHHHVPDMVRKAFSEPEGTHYD